MDRDTFLNRINTHKTPFKADSYHSLFVSVEDFYKLFNEAKQGGIHFINIFIEDLKYRIELLQTKAVQKALEQQRETYLKIQEREFGTGDDEFDEFRKKCINHDWHYDYSDDGAVWRRGNDRQKELEKLAETKGGKYKEYWENYALKKLR